MTLFGANFVVDYPNVQEQTVRFEKLVDDELGRTNLWFDTCFPTLDFSAPSSEPSRIAVLSVDMEFSKAVVQISKIAQANVYI